ncbi:hypothetical protein Fot_15306 [Forsythia ovata]|uniref:Uncharacterized protein n=1 Tax=Forsythia ovata TaxID=205694 RepID=A0ABD1W8S6_9LAMI
MATHPPAVVVPFESNVTTLLQPNTANTLYNLLMIKGVPDSDFPKTLPSVQESNLKATQAGLEPKTKNPKLIVLASLCVEGHRMPKPTPIEPIKAFTTPDRHGSSINYPRNWQNPGDNLIFGDD